MDNMFGKIWILVAALFACIVLPACNVVKPGPLYRTVETANRASDFFQELCANDEWPAEAESFLEYVRNLREVESAELKDNGTCAVQYRSGVLHFFHSSLKEEVPEEIDGLRVNLLADNSDLVQLSGFPNVPGRTSPPATAAVHPHGGSARVRQDILANCEQILEAFENAGYDISESLSDGNYTPQQPTLEWIQGWNRQGIIYLNGHSGTHTLEADVSSPLAGRSFNYLFTSTEWEVAAGEDNPYQEDIDRYRLVFGTDGLSRTLAVTPLYFTEHPEFFGSMPNSIIYLDTCHSLDTGVDVSLADTLISLGVEMVLGWDNRVERLRASQTAALFFDRLCGLSQVNASRLVPPTRPFTAQQVFEYLEDQGRTSQSRANLSYVRRSSGTDTITAACPVISSGYYLVAEPLIAMVENPSINLSGYFGPDRGEVLFNNQPLPEVLLWQEDRIVFYLPDDDTTGEIKVRVNNLESNAMRLWGFSGNATWNVHVTGKYSGTISAAFEGRILLQLMRSEVDGDPETNQAPFGNSWFASERGQMEWDISGEWTDDEGNHHELQAQGNQPIAPQTILASGTPGMLCMITFDLDPNVADATYKIELAAGVSGRETITEPGGTVTEQPWFRASGTPYSADNPLPPDWVIPAGSYSEEDFDITWTEISPDSTPPLPTDPDYAYPAWVH